MGLSRELVVARYNEDVSWVLDSPIPVTIINHGQPLDLDHPRIEVIEEPNRGREAGCFLAHITRNYAELSDWTYFVQGEPHQSPQELWKRVALDHDYTDTTPLTREYLPNFPDRAAKALDKVEFFEGLEVHYGNASRFGNRQPEQNREWLSAVWSQFFISPQPDPWWYGYAASYAVPRNRITDRPLAYWLWLRDLAVKDDNKVEMSTTSAWSYEAVFNYLFSDSTRYIGRPIMRPVSSKVGQGSPRKCGQCGADRDKIRRAIVK